MSDNRGQTSSRMLPPPPPRWDPGRKLGNQPDGMTLPRILIVVLTIIGLFFAFRIVKTHLDTQETDNTPETASDDMRAGDGAESNPPPEIPPGSTPVEPTASTAANAQTTTGTDSPPTVNSSRLNSNLASVENDLRRYKTLPNLTVYVRIVRNMRLMVLAQIAILESLSDARARKPDIQLLRTDAAVLDDISDSDYQTFSIAAYSYLAGKAGRDIASAIASDKSAADLSVCVDLLDTPANDLLVNTRDGALALAYAYISIGRSRARPEISTTQIWADHLRTAASITSSDEHILRQVEKAHQLLLAVIQSCCTTQGSGRPTKDALAMIESAHRSAIAGSNNLYDKIAAHTDASVQSLLLLARLIAGSY